MDRYVVRGSNLEVVYQADLFLSWLWTELDPSASEDKASQLAEVFIFFDKLFDPVTILVKWIDKQLLKVDKLINAL